MNLLSQLKKSGLAISIILISSPAFSKIESCDTIVNNFVIPSAGELRSLVVRFERTQAQRNGAAITAIAGEAILGQITRAIHFAKLEDLLPFFEPETGLTPFMHHDPKLRSAVAQAIYDHPSSAAERAQFLRKIISESIDFDFFDEVIGLNKDQLEFGEEDAFKAEKNPGVRNFLRRLGVDQDHEHWFSDHQTLINSLDSARKLGVKRIVDLGSGTGRLGLIAGLLFPEMQFIGLEIYAPRVAAAQAAAKRWGFQSRIQFRVQDLLDPNQTIPESEYYFILGPTTDADINSQVLARLRQVVTGKRVFVSAHHATTARILSGQTDWLYKLNSNEISDGSLYTNAPFSEWLLTLKRNLANEAAAAAAARRKPEKAN